MPAEIDLTPPPEPTQNAGESITDFANRHAIWWRGRDVAMRQQCIADAASQRAAVAAAIEPMLTVWNALDARIAALANAISGLPLGAPGLPAADSADTVSVSTMMAVANVVKEAGKGT